ncbi:MAG: two-component system sensor histidine kinase NtrB [Fibrobacterota bacterium]
MELYKNMHLIAAGITATIAFFYYFLTSRGVDTRNNRYLFWALMPLSVYIITVFNIYTYGNKENFALLKTVQLASLTLTSIFYPLFLSNLAHIKAGLYIKTVIALLTGTTILRIAVPEWLYFTQQASFQTHTLAWGETILIPMGKTTPLIFATNGLFLLIIVYVLFIILRYTRKNPVEGHAIFIVHAITFLAALHDIFSIFIKLPTPYLSSFAIPVSAAQLAILKGRWLLKGHAVQKSLYERNQQFLHLTRNDDIAIYTKDREKRFITAGQHICKLFTTAEKDITGKTVEEFLPTADVRHIHANDELVLYTGTSNQFEEPLTINGRRLTYLSYKSPVISEQGEVRGLVCISIDITATKNIEQKIAQVEKFTSLGEMAGEIAHNFNNQLTSIIGMADLMHHLKQYDKSAVEGILKTSRVTSNYIRQLLDFSRKGTTGHSTVSLRHIVTHGIATLQHAMPAAISINTYIDGTDDYYVTGHPSNLENAITNLCINARDAISGSGQIDVALKKCYITAHMSKITALAPGYHARIIIEDTGCGIPEGLREKIFTPLFTTKEQDKGTGLGLSSVYKTVKAHGGGIQLYSEVGTGTTIEILLPLKDNSRDKHTPEN